MQDAARQTNIKSGKVDPSNIKTPPTRVPAADSENIPPSIVGRKLPPKKKRIQAKAKAVDDAEALDTAALRDALTAAQRRHDASMGPLKEIPPDAQTISQPEEAEKMAPILEKDDQEVERKEAELEKKEPRVEYDSESSVDSEGSDHDAEATEDEEDQPTARKRQRRGQTLHKLHSGKVADDEYNPSDEESSDSSADSSSSEDDD